MRKLTISKLKCYETEDYFGADECRLEIYVDGVLQAPLKKSLKDGNVWTINRTYQYKNSVEIKLWDEDSPDADDLLGKTVIGTDLKDNASSTFNRDGANYKLWYSVADIPASSSDPVEDSIKAFENSTKTGVWPYINKSELIADIKRVVANPNYINQGNTPLCGPAAIVFELAERFPAKYVQICQNLYENGKFQGRTKEVKPSQTLIKSKVKNGISVVDWMLLATLRDTENAIFPVDSNSNDFVAGVSTPWEMKGWAYELLGFDNVEYESTYFYGEFDAMRKAKRVREAGGVAFLMIHSALLGNSAPFIGHPNHWVSYLGGLSIDEGVWYRHDSGNIRFDCYSWGRKIHVDAGEGSFEDYFWGVVTAI